MHLLFKYGLLNIIVHHFVMVSRDTLMTMQLEMTWSFLFIFPAKLSWLLLAGYKVIIINRQKREDTWSDNNFWHVFIENLILKNVRLLR
jgi:hypothetical protein